MATVKCTDCSGQVSDSAEACPHCGRPMAQGTKPLLPGRVKSPPLNSKRLPRYYSDRHAETLL